MPKRISGADSDGSYEMLYVDLMKWTSRIGKSMMMMIWPEIKNGIMLWMITETETQKVWNNLRSWSKHICLWTTLIMLNIKVKENMMNKPHIRGSNQHRICQLCNTYSMFHTQQRHLNVLKTCSSEVIYLMWLANIFMNACRLKLSTYIR